MAAPEKDSKRLWDDLRAKIKMDEPSSPDRFLGCYLESFECNVSEVKHIMSNMPWLHPRESDVAQPYVPKNPNTKVRGYAYNMQKHFEDNVRQYLELTGANASVLKHVVSPFL